MIEQNPKISDEYAEILSLAVKYEDVMFWGKSGVEIDLLPL
jgi:hypothetical protein